MTGGAEESPAEVHLFVLWDHARPWSEPIIADIQKTFSILDAIELRWTPERAPRHYTRLYAQPLPPGSQKLRDCGTGFPLILVVSDDFPAYGRRRKWGTTYTVNTHLFDAKRRYRGLTGSSSIHCTTDLTESDHDLFLLLGLRSVHYAKRPKVAWDGTVRQVERELTGDLGWSSLEEMLTAIDLTLRYVRLPDVDEGPDMRLLVSNLCGHCGLEWLLSEPDFSTAGSHPTHLRVLIGGRQTVIQTISVGDGYHVRQWQDDMLDHRIRGADGAFVLPPRDALLEFSQELLKRGTSSPKDARQWREFGLAARVPAPPTFDLKVAQDAVAAGIRERGYAEERLPATDTAAGSPIVDFLERLRLAFRGSLITDWVWILRNRPRRDSGARRTK